MGEARRFRYVTPLLLLIFGFLGAAHASKMAKRAAVDRTGHAVRFSTFCTLLLAVAGFGVLFVSGTRGGIVMAAVGVLFILASRWAYFVASPFVSGLVHEHVGEDERIRAAVVSIRTSAPNLVAGVFYFVAALIHRGGDTAADGDATKALALTIILASCVIGISLIVLGRARRRLP
jgi:hypothetical protein